MYQLLLVWTKERKRKSSRRWRMNMPKLLVFWFTTVSKSEKNSYCTACVILTQSQIQAIRLNSYSLVNDANQLVLVMHEMTLTVFCNKNMVMDGLDFVKISAKRHMNWLALNNKHYTIFKITFSAVLCVHTMQHISCKKWSEPRIFLEIFFHEIL